MIRALPFVDIAPAGISVPEREQQHGIGTLRSRALALGATPPIALLAAWTLAVALHAMRPQILPSPVAVWRAAVELFQSGDLASALAVSLARVAVGLGAGGGLGLVFGALLGRSRTLDAYLGPTLRAVCQVPTIAWLPVFMLVFGIGESLKIAVIAKGAFFPMLLNTFAGVRTASVRYHEVADVLELDALARLRLVTLPAALPLIVSGVRLALSSAWHVLVVVEMLASAAGIGHLMAWSRTLFQLDVVFVTIAVIGATGWALDATMLWAQRRLTPWSV